LNLIDKKKIGAESQLEEMRTRTSNDQTQDSVKEAKREVKQRFRSLDTFRGITIFLMIFVNYGSGGFKFMQHVPWHGITIADFVFPWFLWIMGFSIPLATNSLFKKAAQKSRWTPFKRIFIRSLKMFFLGLILNSRFGVELGKLRIFGVLQRLAICYFIVATLELFLYKNLDEQSVSKSWTFYFTDLIWAKFHFLTMALILACWWLVTYLVEVPGCPRGYMGPGGLDQHSLYYNCTGGIHLIELKNK
jgi:heparan-alpha-glucosaminide N-acetyltransferase